MIDTNHGKEKMKRIKEYQMMLNENRIPYLETQKSFLCESKCNSPANVAEIMESCFRINPSQEDIQITESIGKAGSLIGVSLLDHLIIGEKNYTSLREIQAVTFE